MDVIEAIKSALKYLQSGDLQQAELICKDIIKVQPGNINALNFLGAIHIQLKNYDIAIKYFEEALCSSPDNAIVYFNLGNAFKNKGNFNDAIACYQKAIQHDPDMSDAYNNLGIVFKERGNLNDAMACYQKAIQHNPNMADAFNNLGIVFKERGNLNDAIACYQKAIQHNPNMADAYNNLGLLLKEEGQIDNAVMYYQHAVQINPGFADAYYNLGTALYERGNRDAALTAYDKALDCDPEIVAAHFGHCISQLFIIYPDESSILTSRKLYKNEITRLHGNISLTTEQDILAAADAVGSQQPFFLAYQGLNDYELQKIYGDMVCRIMASRYPQFSLLPDMPAWSAGKPLRIGVVTSYFYHHTVWKLFKGWVENIDKERFSLFGYSTSRKKDTMTEGARQQFIRFVEDVYSFEELCQIILSDNLHVIIYPEIGMDPTTVRLAALRLAPVQCISWGHPDTSGLPTIDYYLSSDLMEPTDADKHYTEKLIRLPNLSIYYTPLDISPVPISRATFNLRQDSVLYLCSQSLFKYLPQYDEVFPRIARKVKDCQFLFISYQSNYVTEQFRSRISKVFHRFGINPEDHIVFLPRLDIGRYYAMNRLSDIYLDSIGWSGGNTTFEAIACNLPVITLPGNLMRGRHSYAILRMMGLTETIASTLDEYIELAVRLGQDSELRRHISEKNAKIKHMVYQDKKCIIALENFLEKAVKERMGR